MQKRRKPAGKDVGKWVQKIGSEPTSSVQRAQQVDPTHWELGMHNRIADYTMDIQLQEQSGWVTYGVTLTPDVEGKNRADFYGDLLDLNAKLNGSHIGREGDNLVLTREQREEELDPLSLGRSIRL